MRKLCLNILEDPGTQVYNLGGRWPHFMISEYFHANIVGGENLRSKCLRKFRVRQIVTVDV